MADKLTAFLSGKKVYLVGVVMIVLGCLQDWDQSLITQGFLVLTGRAAIAKIGK